MIGRLFRKTRGPVNDAATRHRGCFIRGQNMIHAPAQVSSDRIFHAVVKKSVLPRLTGMMLPKNINQTPGQNIFVRLPDLRIERDMSQNTFGIVNVNLLGRDVKITAQHKFLIRLKVLEKIFFEPPQPRELIGKRRRVHFLPLRNVDV